MLYDSASFAYPIQYELWYGVVGAVAEERETGTLKTRKDRTLVIDLASGVGGSVRTLVPRSSFAVTGSV
jgi:hypothetical protein